MKIQAMIDRFTDNNLAVVLAEDIGREFLLEKEELPEGAERGDYLVIELRGDEVRGVEIDVEKTALQRSAIKSKLERLRARGTKSRFRKK